MKRFPFFVEGSHNLLLVAWIGIAIACWYTVSASVATANFQVLGYEEACLRPGAQNILERKCHRTFSVRDVGGTFASTYDPPAFVFQPCELSVGRHIFKQPFSLTYTVDGQKRYWHYASHMSLLSLLSASAIVAWYFWTTRLLRRSSQLKRVLTRRSTSLPSVAGRCAIKPRSAG